MERRLVPACPGNTPSSGNDALCVGANQICASTGRRGISFWVFTRPAESAANWQMAGQVCLGPEQAATTQDQIPALTAEQFRRLPWPPATTHIQPGNGRTLVNVPTNVYLEATTRTAVTQLLGQQVRVRAIPIRYIWTFGDGGTLQTTDPGAPYPDLRTTHTFTRPGTVPIGLRTIYRGEYALTGDTWLPVNGTAQVDTPPVTVTVVAARSELVAGTLPT